MKRILTAAVSIPLALAAIFALSDLWFFAALVVVVELAILEYLRIARLLNAGNAPGILLLIVPIAAALMTPGVLPARSPIAASDALLIGAIFLAVGVGSLVVLSRVSMANGLIAIGALGFGLSYFAIPVASLVRLRQIGGPWLLVLCLAIVWLGDTFAFYCGRQWGRRKFAPSISPKKTWAGSIAGLSAGLIAAVVWSLWALGGLSLKALVLALVVGVAAQLGDLVESLLKRGAGVKDSGTLFPGHGGVMDRMDALFFAAPAMWLAIWVMGSEGIVP